jgi:hypothetical protein
VVGAEYLEGVILVGQHDVGSVGDSDPDRYSYLAIRAQAAPADRSRAGSYSPSPRRGMGRCDARSARGLQSISVRLVVLLPEVHGGEQPAAISPRSSKDITGCSKGRCASWIAASSGATCSRAVPSSAPALFGVRGREEGKRRALELLRDAGVEELVVIGGGGSLAGGLALDGFGMPTVGVPTTIDNDIPGTELSIGVDTALNTAATVIDRMKDNSTSHRRAMVACLSDVGCVVVDVSEHEACLLWQLLDQVRGHLVVRRIGGGESGRERDPNLADADGQV